MNDEGRSGEMPLVGRRVLLGVTGSIAAFKAAEVCRELRRQGAEVRVVMTKAAIRFVAPLTVQALSGRAVAVDLFGEPASGDAMGHISLAREADLVLVAPATADLIARAAAGRAEDLLSCILLATGAPVLLAPAMNPYMWDNPITAENVARLRAVAGFELVGPVAGETACGEEGPGRMADPSEVVAAALRLLLGRTTA